MRSGWTSLRIKQKPKAAPDFIQGKRKLFATNTGADGVIRQTGIGISANELPDSELCINVPLKRWVHFGNFDQADIRLNHLPTGTHGRLLIAKRGLLLIDWNDEISLHCSQAEKQVAGINLVFHLLDDLTAESSRDSCFELFVHFIQSDFYQRLEEGLLKQDPGGLRDWNGARLFTSEGLPSEELVWTVQRIIGPEVDRGEAYLSRLLETTCDYLEATSRGFGLLDPLVRQHGVKEVLVNRYDEIYVEGKSGMVACEATFPSRDVLERLVESLLARMDSRLDATQPVAQGVVDGRYRVHIVSEQICPGGPSLSIRCFPEHTFQLDELIGPAGQKQDVEGLLIELVRKRKNVLVCGETSSGKTSLMEALSAHIPDSERVIVAEDVRELRLSNAHKVYLQTHQGFGSSVAEMDLRGLVKESLRMRPDRLVIGECRGGEALDLLQALNTGHQGSMTSIHGSCALAALRRLETLSMFGNTRVTRTTAAALIASGVHVVVQMSRCCNGSRQVQSISYLSPNQTSQVSAAEYEIIKIFEEESR